MYLYQCLWPHVDCSDFIWGSRNTTLIFHATAIYVPAKNMLIKCQTMPNAWISQHASTGEVGCIWCCSHQSCRQSLYTDTNADTNDKGQQRWWCHRSITYTMLGTWPNQSIKTLQLSYNYFTQDALHCYIFKWNAFQWTSQGTLL